jgi:AcrR family transcriptional regulator
MAGGHTSDGWIRLVGAVPPTVRVSGFAALTPGAISAQAGVSGPEFFRNFRDATECFIASYRHHAEWLIADVASAAALGESWPARTRLALSSMLRFLAERPDVAHMTLVDVLAAGPAAVVERDRAIAALGALVGTSPGTADPPPELLLRSAGASMHRLIYTWVVTDRAEQLEQLLPTCLYLALVPALGPAGAAAECGWLEGAPVPA